MTAGGDEPPAPAAARPEPVRPPGPVVVTAALAAPVTVAFSTIPGLRFAYESATLRTALETAQALVGGLVAYLAYGRFVRSRDRNDLAIAYALALLASAGLVLGVGSSVVRHHSSPFGVWAPLVARLVGASLLAAAAVAPPRRLRPGAHGGILLVPLAAAVTVIALVVRALEPVLPPGVELALTAEASDHPLIEGHIAVLVAQLLSLGAHVVAAWGFSYRWQRRREPLTLALAVGSVLAAFSRLNFFLYPSLYTTLVHVGDVLRLGFYLVLLGGALREIQDYWTSRTALAVGEERRRFARDLHDGVVQELAFIRTAAGGAGEAPASEEIRQAAERALGEARRAVAALAGDSHVSLDVAVREAVLEVVERAGSRARLELAPGLVTPPPVHEALVRIAREAATNAVVHGRAPTLRVALDHSAAGVELVVSDDGAGFDPAAVDGGHGLGGMRDRARLLGGDLRVESAPGRGATVEAFVPLSAR